MLLHKLAALLACRIIGAHSHQAQCNVVQHSSKHGARRFDVGAPAAILLLMVQKVCLHGSAMGIRVHRLQMTSNICCNDETWQKKVWSTIVACPMTIIALKHSVKLEALAERGIHIGWPCGVGTRSIATAPGYWIA